MIITPRPLVPAEYAPYGDVVSADGDGAGARPANQGTAMRRDHLVELVNLRAHARANLASFRCQPREDWPMPVGLLEKHPASTQLFVPMNAAHYLVVVALGGAAPELTTLRAFLARGTQGVSYHPGVWHHPMVALEAPTDFACLVWEDGSAVDCVVVGLGELGVAIARPDVR